MPILGAALRAELAAAVGVTDLRRELRAVVRELRRLRAQLRVPRGLVAGGRVRSDGKRTLHLSPARRAALKLQGQYMGSLRALRPRQKATVKAVKAAKGFAAAVKFAKKLSGR